MVESLNHTENDIEINKENQAQLSGPAHSMGSRAAAGCYLFWAVLDREGGT